MKKDMDSLTLDVRLYYLLTTFFFNVTYLFLSPNSSPKFSTAESVLAFNFALYLLKFRCVVDYGQMSTIAHTIAGLPQLISCAFFTAWSIDQKRVNISL